MYSQSAVVEQTGSGDLQKGGTAPRRGSVPGGLLLVILFVALLGLGVSIACLAIRLVSETDVATVARLQAIAADILVPMFAAVLTAITAPAILKGLLDIANNQVRGTKEPIRLFDW